MISLLLSSWKKNNLFSFLTDFQKFDEKAHCVSTFNKVKKELKLFFINYGCNISLAFDVMCCVGINQYVYLVTFCLDNDNLTCKETICY